MSHENTNWNYSAAGVCIKDGKVLLARHTYGAGKGLLIIPGGYLENGESPEQAVVREFREEVNIEVEPTELIGMRFNTRDWYAVFRVEYISGTAQSDGDENSEVVWVDVNEAQVREDVPYLTKILVKKALEGGGFASLPYESSKQPASLYGAADL